MNSARVFNGFFYRWWFRLLFRNYHLQLRQQRIEVKLAFCGLFRSLPLGYRIRWYLIRVTPVNPRQNDDDKACQNAQGQPNPHRYNTCGWFWLSCVSARHFI